MFRRLLVIVFLITLLMPLYGRVSFSAGLQYSSYTLYMDDEDAEIEIDCMEIIDSYDPNDKSVSPQGITATLAFLFSSRNRSIKSSIVFERSSVFSIGEQ